MWRLKIYSSISPVAADEYVVNDFGELRKDLTRQYVEHDVQKSVRKAEVHQSKLERMVKRNLRLRFVGNSSLEDRYLSRVGHAKMKRAEDSDIDKDNVGLNLIHR